MVKEELKPRRPSKDHGHPRERRMSVLSQTGHKIKRGRTKEGHQRNQLPHHRMLLMKISHPQEMFFGMKRLRNFKSRRKT